MSTPIDPRQQTAAVFLLLVPYEHVFRASGYAYSQSSSLLGMFHRSLTAEASKQKAEAREKALGINFTPLALEEAAADLEHLSTLEAKEIERECFPILCEAFEPVYASKARPAYKARTLVMAFWSLSKGLVLEELPRWIAEYDPGTFRRAKARQADPALRKGLEDAVRTLSTLFVNPKAFEGYRY
jgi:hypothetical protein